MVFITVEYFLYVFHEWTRLLVEIDELITESYK